MEIESYRKCMASRMKGNLKDLSPTERKIAFSVSAKVCSGKARNENDAIIMIKKDHPDWFTEAYQ